MPHYEFICQDCHKGFLKTLSQQDYEEGCIIKHFHIEPGWRNW